MLYSPTKPSIGAKIDWTDPLSQGLVGCWLFNEQSGGVIDIVTNRTAQLVGNPTWTANGLTTNGSSSYALYNDKTMNGYNGNFNTMFVKCKANVASQSDQRIFSLSEGSNMIVLQQATTKFRLHLRNSVGADWCVVDTNSSVDTNKAQTFCAAMDCSYSGAPINLYINGKLDTSTSRTSNTSAPMTSPTKITFGALYRSSAASFWSGEISVAMYFNRCLSAQEIQQLHEMTKGW
jgi:hypothetical protein